MTCLVESPLGMKSPKNQRIVTEYGEQLFTEVEVNSSCFPLPD